MREWISLPRVEGQASRQAHADLPEGTYERELGREGFYGPATHMYHRRPPTGWSGWEGPLRPRAFDLNVLNTAEASPWSAREILSNGHLRYRFWRTRGAMPNLVRNADGDDLMFIHEGRGDFFCDYGHLSIEEGDLSGRSARDDVAYRVLWTGHVPSHRSDQRQLSTAGKGYRGSSCRVDPAMLDTPRIDGAFLGQQTADGQEETWAIEIKRRGELSSVTYPYNPLDAVGWHGTLAPVRINVRDIRPVTSPRYHLPPSAHTTFMAERFVVCTFAPRPIESDPGALKLPFFPQQ